MYRCAAYDCGMTLRGYVKDGVVVPYEPSLLEEGTEVEIQPSRERVSKSRTSATKGPGKASTRKAKPRKKVAGKRKPKPRKAGTADSLGALLDKITGIAKGLPRDFARNHDHYIRGAPKRQ